MASKVIDVDTSKRGELTLTVEHLPTDSYRRSVRRAAAKAVRTADLVRAGWRLGHTVTEGGWDYDVPAPDGKSRTKITFVFG